MNKRKTSGAFYTPKVVADFMVKHLSRKIRRDESFTILEPSAGDGIFVQAVFDHKKLAEIVNHLVAVEKNGRELNKIQIHKKKCIRIKSDFLIFQKNNKSKYDLVIGNPPYIKANLLTKNQTKLCVEIHQNANLSSNKPKNIWTSFLIRCIQFTKLNGTMALVLPAELLQVKYAAELRELIIKEFLRVEIFTFNELLFPDCKGQDTMLLICEKISDKPGVFYCNINKLNDLKVGEFKLSQNVNIRETKWTHHHLETEEIELLEKIRNCTDKISNYCNSKPGVVTAANDYFIVNRDTVKKYSLENYVRPIIKRNNFINGSAVLTEKEFGFLIDNEKPAFLLSLDKTSILKNKKRLNEYLKIGVKLDIDKGYKTSIRENWYEIPNIGLEPDAFFFRRCYEYPKLVKNEARVLATDSAYLVTMKDNHNVNDLIYSFYNSMTLAFAELHGRYYGGGVLELTPNEFKNLPIKVVNIDINERNLFFKSFKEKESIKEICLRNDRKILRGINIELDDESINRVSIIREKLFLRRLKMN